MVVIHISNIIHPISEFLFPIDTKNVYLEEFIWILSLFIFDGDIHSNLAEFYFLYQNVQCYQTC